MGQDVIVASDKVVAEAPHDLAFRIAQTGYMHLDQPEPFLPELEAFLSAGPPPIYAGFGSMPKLDQMACVQLIVDAARSTGERVVISKFWDEPTGISSSDDFSSSRDFPI